MRTLSLVLLTALVAAGQEDGPVRQGGRQAMPEAEMIFNAPFMHFDETHGKAVAYVWFLPESQGRGLVTKLNALHAKYAKKGLVIAAVSHRDEEVVEAWVKRHRPKFAVAWEPSNISMGRYGFMQWPSAVLVSPRGEVLWMGGGDAPPASAITKALKTAVVSGPGAPLRLIVDLPKSLSKVQRAMELGQLDKALAAIAKSSESEAKKARTVIHELLDAKLERAREEEKKSDYHLASLLFTRIVEHAPKSKWGVEAKAALAGYRRDPKIKNELAGGVILEKAQARIDAKDWKGAEKLLKKLVAKKFEGTKVRERAEILLLKMK